MTLRRSSFVHVIDLDAERALVIHAVTQLRLPVSADIAAVIAAFAEPVPIEPVVAGLAAALTAEPDAIRAAIALLRDRDILTADSDAEERQACAAALAAASRRDPLATLDARRRAETEGSHPYWSVTAPHTLAQAVPLRRRLDVLLFGDCDVQMETDFLRREAATRGIDLRVAASFVSDTALAAERRHDAIVVGALQARHAIPLGAPLHHGGDPARIYVETVRATITALRALTTAPILIDDLPEPTLQPLGVADRGVHSHRNRFRRTNLALAELAEAQEGVHLVDVAAILGGTGSAHLLDDGLVSFTHFGAPGWMLERPESERAATHGLFPDTAPLRASVGHDPYGRERLMAAAHMDALTAILGLDAKKCVIVDLDGVLWPGVLAETGAPFAWTPEISGPYSYIGLYFGIHEALRALKRRGILLACVSKNDADTVARLWTYAPQDPHHRLLFPGDFVTTRINWRDKADNIASISAELGFPAEAFVFIDDTPRERERVAESLPGITVWGEDLFALRRRLLTDPRLQPVTLTAAAADRTALVRAQLDRKQLCAATGTEQDFLQSLEIVAEAQRITPDTADPTTLDRIVELFARTTQMNATGMRVATADLRRLVESDKGRVVTLRMRDRLADHGLVGAVVVDDGEILNLAVSCRVIGLGGERALLDAIRTDPGAGVACLRGRIVPTDRNLPVRNLYEAAGFTRNEDGSWSA